MNDLLILGISTPFDKIGAAIKQWKNLLTTKKEKGKKQSKLCDIGILSASKSKISDKS